MTLTPAQDILRREVLQHVALRPEGAAFAKRLAALGDAAWLRVVAFITEPGD